MDMEFNKPFESNKTKIFIKFNLISDQRFQ